MISLLIEAFISLETTGSYAPLILLLGPVGAVGVYWGLYQYYRNTGASHSFERETAIEAKPITGTDQKVDEVHGTQRTSIEGNNARDYRQRVRRL